MHAVVQTEFGDADVLRVENGEDSVAPGGRACRDGWLRCRRRAESVGSRAESIRTLRAGGRIVVLGSSLANRADLAVRPFYFGQYDLLGTTMGGPDVAGLLNLLATHRVPPPVVDRVFLREHAADAHCHPQSATGFGKTVLCP